MRIPKTSVATISRAAARALFLLTLVFANPGVLTAADFSLIDQLPSKMVAAQKRAMPGWEGSNREMNDATTQYHAALIAMMKELVTGYSASTTEADVDAYSQALSTKNAVEQRLENPSGEPLGSGAGLDVASAVNEALEKEIPRIVRAIVDGDDGFKINDWERRWTKAVATANLNQANDPPPPKTPNENLQ